MEQKDYTLDQVIEQSFDFSSYSEVEKQEMIAETSGLIMETALLRGLDEAGKDVQEKFNDLMEVEPDEDTMHDFISENISNFSDIVIDEVKKMQTIEQDSAAE